jgi:uncharacterized protein
MSESASSPSPSAESAIATPSAAGPTSDPAQVLQEFERAAANRRRAEEEFGEVPRACGFYGAMLLPVLVGTAWSFHTKRDDVILEFWVASVLYAIIAAFAFAWREEWTGLLRRPRLTSRRMFVGVAVTPVVSVAAAHLLGIAAKTWGLPINELTRGYGSEGFPLWLLVLSVVVLAPLFEEVAFRGVLLEKLQRLMGPTQAIWVTAILFGLIHFSVLSMAVFLIPIAVLAGYATFRTGSLLPALYIHSAHNAGVLGLELLFG